MSSQTSNQTSDLLEVVKKIARKHFGGHFTIFNFTTHYKAMFGTPNLDSGAGRQEVLNLKPASSLEEALINLILDFLKNDLFFNQN